MKLVLVLRVQFRKEREEMEMIRISYTLHFNILLQQNERRRNEFAVRTILAAHSPCPISRDTSLIGILKICEVFKKSEAAWAFSGNVDTRYYSRFLIFS